MIDLRLQAAAEAIATLKLLRPDAAATIARLLDPEMREHPRAIATAYRKGGVQVPATDKRALGVRKNAFLSIEALEEITPAGLADPLAAHEVTLLRATFTLIRATRVAEEESLRVQLGKALIGFVHQTLGRDCAACNRLDSKVTSGSEAHVLPPADCVVGCTANYGIRPKIDFPADVD
jgi:hypothetical protein